MKTLRVLVALLATTLILSVASRSHGSPDPKLIEAVKNDGRVVYWTTMTLTQCIRVVDTFHKRYPFIKATIGLDTV